MKEDPREIRERELLAKRVERQTTFLNQHGRKKFPWAAVAAEKQRMKSRSRIRPSD
jgi:hypothetical protein